MSPTALYNELVAKLGRVRRLEQWIALQTGGINALAATIAIWTGALSVEALATMRAPGRTTLVTIAACLNLAAIAWLLLPPLARLVGVLRGADDDSLARRVGSGIPAIGDHLLNTLQLYRAAAAGALVAGASPQLAEAAIVSQGEPLRHHDYSIIVERDDRRRALLFLSSAIISVCALFGGLTGTYRDALDRLIHYNTEYLQPAPFSLALEPGDRRLIRGDSVQIVVRATGIPPRTLTLRMQAGDAPAEEVQLRSDASGLFRYTLASVRETTKYQAVAGPIASAEHTLAVADRPEIRTFNATVAHPAYTGRGLEKLPDNVGDVSGLRGSAVNVSITTNVEPASAVIVQLFPRGGRAHATADTAAHAVAASRNAAVPASSLAAVAYDTVRIPMAVQGTSAHAGFRLSRDGEYYIALRTSDGIENVAPVHYHMAASGDGPPTITLIEPTDSANVDQTMLLPVQVHIADDYGFSRLRIMYRLAASRYAPPSATFQPQPMPLPAGGARNADVPYVWDMTRMGMVPEDVVEMYVEVYDNDAVSGPKVARTDTIRVRFPSLDEVLKQAENAQTQANADLEKMMKQAEQSAKEMETLNRELMKQMAQNQTEASWQNKQKMQELMKQREELQKNLEQVAENLRNVAEKLEQAKAISPETLKKYTELQKMFDELKNPALLEQMRKMQEQLDKMTPEQMAEAMKNFKYNDEQFRKAIDRTMNILKRMQTEQKVDEMIKRADELQRQQENLNDQMRQTDPKDAAMREALSERQKQLAEEARRMEQQMAELRKQMEALGDEAPQKEMQEADQTLQQDSPREQMEQAGQEMKQGDMQKAQKQGEQAQASAQKFKEKMQAVKQKMGENGRREVLNKMKKSLKDLIDLSRREEDLKNRTEQTQPNSQQFRDLAEQQKEMEDQMQNLGDQMMSLGQKTFAVTPEMGRELGNAMKQMQQASGSLEGRDGAGASQQEGNAMGSMNSAAKMMSQAINQMQNEGQGQGQGMGMGMGSMGQRLQQMAAQQQMINQAMQQQQGEGGQQGEGSQGEQQGKGEKRNGKQGTNGQNGEGGEQNGQEGKNGQGMQRLSQQQDDVRKSLDQLNKEAQESGGTRKNMLGDLERAAKEIDEVLSDMKSGEITPETMQRQERILSRLLDAARSQRERDFDKKRESKPGIDVVRQSPGELKFNDAPADARARRDQLNTRDQGYTPDYEYMIRKYFEVLGTGSSTLR